MVKPVLLKNIQIQGELSGTINRHGNAQRACCFLQVSPTLPSVSRAVPAGSARRLAPPPANRVPATPSPPRGRPRARRVPSTTSRVRTGGKATTRKRVTYKPVFPSPTLPGEGWAECKLRPPCSQKDFFQIHTACDGEGKVGSLRRSHTPTSTHRLSGVCVWFEQTQVLYRWVEPKICLENTSGAAALPPLGPREPCPPCNPGYRSGNDSACLPCPPGTHSDGTGGKPWLLPWQHASVAVANRGDCAYPRMHRLSRRFGAGAGLRVQMVERAAAQHEELLFQRRQLQV